MVFNRKTENGGSKGFQRFQNSINIKKINESGINVKVRRRREVNIRARRRRGASV